MAHELTIRAGGTAEMAFVGETPWHGLGQQLEDGASILDWQRAAGMDWRVQRSKVRYATAPNADFIELPDQHVLFRSDTKAALGIVSDNYKVVQPVQVLEFFRDLVSDCGFRLETAGTLFGGRRFWALAKLTEARLAGWDRVGGYVLLSTSADGSMATTVQETTVRVVCNNTLSMAAAEKAGRRVAVRHSTVFNEAKVKADLGLTAEHFDAFIEKANVLTQIAVSDAQAEQWVASLLRPVEEVEGEPVLSQRKARGEDKIMALFRGDGRGSVNPGSCNTAWGLVNAVTEYVDHYATAKSRDHRLASAWNGPGEVLKAAAFQKALSLA